MSTRDISFLLLGMVIAFVVYRLIGCWCRLKMQQREQEFLERHNLVPMKIKKSNNEEEENEDAR